MFIDASAIVAILNSEAGWEDIVRRIEDHKEPHFVSPLVRFEASVALARSRSGQQSMPSAEQISIAEQSVDQFCQIIQARDVTITSKTGKLALNAAKTYGKIVGHDAALNFGDCFTYGCAASLECKIVYKGNDFAKTDMR